MDCITCMDDRMQGAPFNCFCLRSNVISFGNINVVVVVAVVIAPRGGLQQLPKDLMPIVERIQSGNANTVKRLINAPDVYSNTRLGTQAFIRTRRLKEVLRYHDNLTPSSRISGGSRGNEGMHPPTGTSLACVTQSLWSEWLNKMPCYRRENRAMPQ